jgi:hypothetical protein
MISNPAAEGVKSPGSLDNWLKVEQSLTECGSAIWRTRRLFLIGKSQ